MAPHSLAVASPDCGAELTFLGVVRNHADGKTVSAIDYSCYESMALQELTRLTETIAERYGLVRIIVVHRIGHLKVGEASLGVAASAPHRREVFLAVMELIDELKKVVPIWKKEIGPDGSHWV